MTSYGAAATIGPMAQGKVRLAALVFAVPAGAIWIALILNVTQYSSRTEFPVWGLAVLFTLTEMWPLVLTDRRSAPAVGLSAAPLVLGLFFAPSWAIIAAYLAGSFAAAAIRREVSSPYTSLWVAQNALFMALAVLAFRAIVPVHTGPALDLGWDAYGGAYAAAGLLTLTCVATSTILNWQTRKFDRETSLASAIHVGGAVSFGMLAVGLLWVGSRAVFIAVLLGVILLGGYRTLLAERRQRRVAEFLQGTEAALHRPRELETAIVGLINRARVMFDAQIAQLTIYPIDAGEAAYRTTVHAGETAPAEVMVAVPLTQLDDILEADSDGVIIHRDHASAASRQVLDLRKIDQAMVALLKGQSRIVGSLMVGCQRSARGFDQRDLQLFRTLVIQTAATLETGRAEQNIARLSELQEQLSHQAFHDPLTDLANRALFSDRIDHALLRRARTGAPIGVLFIDLDDFKTINDTLGHAAGDQLLVGVAERLRFSLRKPDTAARLGGDEFAVLVEDIHTIEDAEEIADRVADALAAPFPIAGQQVTVHASIGVACSDVDTDSAVLLMSHADVAMYAAKSAGKAQRARFVAGMEAEIIERHRLRSDLEQAVTEEQFDVHFQPIFDLRTGTVVATEALVRWRHPERGMVPPDDFIRVAEETGVILALGKQVLRKACSSTLRWQARHQRETPLWVSVNISARQLQQPLFVEEVIDIVNRAGLRPNALVLELTESMVLEDAAMSIAKLHALRRAGVRIAIDDFGTGYSSLSYLRRLPVDILKIAKPFVDDLDMPQDEGDFARAIVGIGAALRMDMIAEGIESVDQLRVLRDLGCRLGQGFHLSRPVTAETMDTVLDSGRLTPDRLGYAERVQAAIVRLPSAG